MAQQSGPGVTGTVRGGRRVLSPRRPWLWVLLAVGLLVVGDHETGPVADRVETAHDQVDLLGRGVTLLADAVERPLLFEAVEQRPELGVVVVGDAETAGELLRLERASGFRSEILDDSIRTDRHDHLPSPAQRTPTLQAGAGPSK